MCFVPENRQNQKEHDARIVNFRPRPPLEKFPCALPLSTIHVTVRFGSVQSQFRRTPWSSQEPLTNIMRGLVARRIFKVSSCLTGIIYLQTSMFSPDFEPRPYGTAVCVTNR
ncbi:hypothetical protein TNCV_326051 [Trichonephila clavipes]|nr:hypothetical protein TNCV_326051 [Trichonephila clavipes]